MKYLLWNGPSPIYAEPSVLILYPNVTIDDAIFRNYVCNRSSPHSHFLTLILYQGDMKIAVLVEKYGPLKVFKACLPTVCNWVPTS